VEDGAYRYGYAYRDKLLAPSATNKKTLDFTRVSLTFGWKMGLPDTAAPIGTGFSPHLLQTKKL